MSAWLIDKSALVRLTASPDAVEWAERVERGLVRIATWPSAGTVANGARLPQK